MARDPLSDLERFADEVSRASGDNLVSLVLYGSAARGEFNPARSDLNLLLILREASPAALKPLGAAIRDWVKHGQPPPWVFTEEGFKASADVFPMEIEDMREAHGVLRGVDPLEGVTTERAHLRAQLEREARQKLLHLRTHYPASAPDGRALSALVESSFRGFLPLFRALLRLHGEHPPRAVEELVRLAAEAAGCEATLFRWAIERHAGKKVGTLQAYDLVAERYLEAIEQIVLHIDRLE